MKIFGLHKKGAINLMGLQRFDTGTKPAIFNRLDGRLCDGDGRTRKDATKQYGSGGTLAGKNYMLSITYNAPLEAFDDPDQEFFGGRGVADLFWPMHLNFKFFGMTPLKTFACHDVLKNPDVENDFVRFDAHLDQLFLSVG